MSTPLDPQRVIALGALSAIGKATLRLYAEEGARIVIAGRGEERLHALAEDLRARGAKQVVPWQVDLADCPDTRSEFGRMAAAIGGLDGVLLFYGTLGDNAKAEKDIDEARRILQTNFTSAAEWCLTAADIIESQAHGSLVVIGSVAGDRGRQSNYIYGAAKGGLALLMQGLAHRLAECGGRAVIVKPGFVDTPMTKPGHANPEIAKKRLEATPLGRFGTPADIAAGCLYLASDEAAWVTGSELVIDGGMTAN